MKAKINNGTKYSALTTMSLLISLNALAAEGSSTELQSSAYLCRLKISSGALAPVSPESSSPAASSESQERWQKIKDRISPRFYYDEEFDPNALAHRAIVEHREDLLLRLIETNGGYILPQDYDASYDLVKSAIRAENAEALEILFSYGARLPTMSKKGDTMYALEHTKNGRVREVVDSQRQREDMDALMIKQDNQKRAVSSALDYISKVRQRNYREASKYDLVLIGERLIEADNQTLFNEFLSSIIEANSGRSVFELVPISHRKYLVAAAKTKKLEWVQKLHQIGLSVLTAERIYEEYDYLTRLSDLIEPISGIDPIRSYIKDMAVSERATLQKQKNRALFTESLWGVYKDGPGSKITPARKNELVAHWLNTSESEFQQTLNDYAKGDNEKAQATFRSISKNGLIKGLIDSGANLTKYYSDPEIGRLGYDLVKEAIRAENAEVLKMLKDAGAKLPALNPNGRTQDVLDKTTNQELKSLVEEMKAARDRKEVPVQPDLETEVQKFLSLQQASKAGEKQSSPGESDRGGAFRNHWFIKRLYPNG